MSWEEILRSIRAQKSSWRLLKLELQEISNKIREGHHLTGQEISKLKEEVWESTEPFIDENGNCFVLYIHDRSSRWSFSRFKHKTSQYKFHFKWCVTLEGMDRMGRRERYKGKWDIENPFFGSSSDKRERLYVCKNCLRSFSFNEGEPAVEEFNMKEFFNTYGLQNLKQPTHQHKKHKYTSDWSRISREYKQSKGWVCEDCGKDFSLTKILLHTHHKNGVKDDNAPDNLEAVCCECHSKKDAHANIVRGVKNEKDSHETK